MILKSTSTLAKKHVLFQYATTVNVLKLEIFIYCLINLLHLRIRIVTPIDRKQIHLPDKNKPSVVTYDTRFLYKIRFFVNELGN